MPKKLTIIGVLAALVLGIVGLTQQNAEAYTAQSFCVPAGTGACTGGASPVDVILCYGGAAPTVLGTCGAGSSPNTTAVGDGVTPLVNYTQIVVPAGSRLTLPVTYTPKTWGHTSPATCTNDEPSQGGVTCTGANKTGDVTATTDLLCDGSVDVLASPAVVPGGAPPATWPGGLWTGAGFNFYRTYDAGTGPPVDENAYVVQNQPMPQSFPFVSIDKSRLTDLWVGNSFYLHLPTIAGSATPLQLLSRDSNFASPNGVNTQVALLAGSPAPPSASYLCLQSPQNSVTSNNTLLAPTVAGYYPRWVDVQSDVDFVDGSVTRVVVMNCVIVGTPAETDIDHDCLGDTTEAGLGITPVAGNPSSSTDIDGDGLPNGLEVANGSAPVLPCAAPNALAPSAADCDSDGVNDFTELFQFTNPNNNDTDGDGRLDKQNNLAGFNATAPYYNQAATTDNCPAVANNAGGDLQNNTDSKPDHTLTPASAFTDITNPHADYMGDACDSDADNDGMTNVAEASFGLSSVAPGVGNGWCHLPGTAGTALASTDPLNADTDGDGGLDGLECQFTSNPLLATGTQARYPNPAAGEDPDLDLLFRPGGLNADAENLYHTGSIAIGGATCPQVAVGACSGGLLNDIDGDGIIGTSDADSDNDGLIDGVEVKFYGTSPSNADTDGDGCPDGKEAGDINGDRKVTSIDLGQVAARFGNITTLGVVDPLKTDYDFNKDGKINATDLGGVAKVFGNCPAQTGRTPSNSTVIVH